MTGVQTCALPISDQCRKQETGQYRDDGKEDDQQFDKRERLELAIAIDASSWLAHLRFVPHAIWVEIGGPARLHVFREVKGVHVAVNE